MSRRKAAPALKRDVILKSPDTTRDQSPFIPFGNDPYEDYLRQYDLFTKRSIVYSLFERCQATAAISTSVADEIASQEIYVTPTEANPSATTLLLAKRAIDIINNAMNRRGGVVDFITSFVKSYWGSKTGVFVLTPRDGSGAIQSIDILQPLLPRPYYGWYGLTPQVGDLSALPMPQRPIVNPPNEQTYLAQGIWYIDGSMVSRNYYALDYADQQYWQACADSLAYGAFQEGKPKAESALSKIVIHIALEDYLRRTILCTDESQVIVWNNIDESRVISKSNQLKAITQKRKDGERIDPEDEGVRLHVWGKDPERAASVNAINLRAFPEGFDPVVAEAKCGEEIALIFGVNARRASPDTQKERFGNATQAAMLNADEPGVKALKTVITGFLTSVLLEGEPLRAEFMSRNSAENYGLVMKDQVASQVVSQAGAAMTPEQATSYLIRQGVLLPSDTGQPALRTGDGTGTPMATGFVSLRDSKGFPLTYERATEITSKRPRISYKAVDGFEACTQEGTARWEEWITNELPTTVDRSGLNRAALVDEVDGIAIEVFNDLVQCAKRAAGYPNDPRVRGLIDVLRAGWYNLIGSPQIRIWTDSRPDNNLFDALWGMAGKIAIGTAGIAALQALAATYLKHLIRYFNSAQTIVWMSEYMNTTGPVQWVLGAVERHCPMCPSFAGIYPSFEALLRRTGGLLPGDIRLTCSGNCKCSLRPVAEATS